MLALKNKFYLIIFSLFQTTIFSQNVIMVDPSNDIGIDNWGIVNDGVMGGVSQSNIYLNEVNNIIFAGNVSLKITVDLHLLEEDLMVINSKNLLHSFFE